jgi:hypothetical protein
MLFSRTKTHYKVFGTFGGKNVLYITTIFDAILPLHGGEGMENS